MKNIVYLLLIVPFLGVSQIESSDSIFFISHPELSESITKVELKADTLYLYKTLHRDSDLVCTVFHIDGKCDWNQPDKIRDVYVSRKGKIVFLRTERPKYKTIKKEVEETIESW